MVTREDSRRLGIYRVSCRHTERMFNRIGMLALWIKQTGAELIGTTYDFDSDAYKFKVQWPGFPIHPEATVIQDFDLHTIDDTTVVVD